MLLNVTDELLRPFIVSDNTSLSLSGGRTSALMLWLTLKANNGKPDNLTVSFANTGKEREETLVFVQRMQDEWQVPIIWHEYIPEPPYYRTVDFASASRKGEPFAALIKKRNMTPNRMTRFCTQELKIRAMERRTKAELGWNKWDAFVGLRVDEPKRVLRLALRCAANKDAQRGRSPLATAKITKPMVMDFWRHQSFDLGLQDDQGNCDLCFLKGRDKLLRLIYAEPSRADWWAEQDLAGHGGFHGPNRIGGKGYAGLKQGVLLEQSGAMLADTYIRRISNSPMEYAFEEAFGGDDFQDLECGCTD